MKPSKKKSPPVARSGTGFPLTEQEAEPLASLLKRLKISKWDFLILGDGSGSNWERECAWGTVSIEKTTMERLVWWGYANRGTVNIAESMAYLWPVMWLANREAAAKKGGSRAKGMQVHIVTDSEYVRTSGESDDMLRTTNGPIWDAFDSVARQGIVLNWHWSGREEAGLNQYTDQLSKLVRKSFKAYNMQERMAAGGSVGGEVKKTVYEVNPAE